MSNHVCEFQKEFLFGADDFTEEQFPVIIFNTNILYCMKFLLLIMFLMNNFNMKYAGWNVRETRCKVLPGRTLMV
ncbi:hypothetical protein CE143_04935 [Photorhabdus luminescens]|uniref:Uncharacterized protein n=1 Tax=Photorhabdus akhurstii TaxID=171438 RepID=A0ABX8LTE7_9GAMM|nr:hypothetical protein B0X70_05005 [Photorhabdus akhurstii]UJD74380.1 hypothetical protein CE143_04935 [Photorhabdus luminescens]